MEGTRVALAEGLVALRKQIVAITVSLAAESLADGELATGTDRVLARGRSLLDVARQGAEAALATRASGEAEGARQRLGVALRGAESVLRPYEDGERIVDAQLVSRLRLALERVVLTAAASVNDDAAASDDGVRRGDVPAMAVDQRFAPPPATTQGSSDCAAAVPVWQQRPAATSPLVLSQRVRHTGSHPAAMAAGATAATTYSAHAPGTTRAANRAGHCDSRETCSVQCTTVPTVPASAAQNRSPPRLATPQHRSLGRLATRDANGDAAQVRADGLAESPGLELGSLARWASPESEHLLAWLVHTRAQLLQNTPLAPAAATIRGSPVPQDTSPASDAAGSPRATSVELSPQQCRAASIPAATLDTERDALMQRLLARHADKLASHAPGRLMQSAQAAVHSNRTTTIAQRQPPVQHTEEADQVNSSIALAAVQMVTAAALSPPAPVSPATSLALLPEDEYDSFVREEEAAHQEQLAVATSSAVSRASPLAEYARNSLTPETARGRDVAAHAEPELPGLELSAPKIANARAHERGAALGGVGYMPARDNGRANAYTVVGFNVAVATPVVEDDIHMNMGSSGSTGESSARQPATIYGRAPTGANSHQKQFVTTRSSLQKHHDSAAPKIKFAR
jgi:hypothetical protein